MLSVIMKEETGKKKDPQILLFSFRLRIGRNLWCGLWGGGSKRANQYQYFCSLTHVWPPTQPPLFLQYLYLFLLFFFFFFFLSCLVFIRDQRCTSTDTLHACSHTWSTVLVPRSHLELRSKLELEKKIKKFCPDLQFRWLRTCGGSVLSGYLIFYFSSFLSWTAFAEEQNSLPIWGRGRKSHRLCFGVSVSCWAQQHTAFHTHSGRLFPAYLDEKWIYLPTVSSKCNTTLAGLIWSSVTSTGHWLPVQQLLQLFHFASLLFQCDQGANCLGVSLFLWMPNEFPQNYANCSKMHYSMTEYWEVDTTLPGCVNN